MPTRYNPKQREGVEYIMPSLSKIEIPAPNIQSMKVTIVGTAPIIFHRWDEKAKLMLLKTQQKDPAAKKREPRDPKGEFLKSFYLDSDGDISWPILNIKQAMVDAARNIEGITMALLRGAIFTKGDVDGRTKILVDGKPIKVSNDIQIYEDDDKRKTIGLYGHDEKNPNIELREDMVKVGMGSADLRYRGSVKNWTMEFIVSFNGDVLSAGQVLNLLNTAGFSCGLGEWRPQCSGNSGTFEVAQDNSE